MSAVRACVARSAMAAGNLAFGHLAVAAEREGLHRHQVDDAAEALLLADGELNGHDLAGAVAVQGLERPFEAGAVAIQAAERDDARQAEARGFRPRLLGLHFDAVHGVHDDQRGLGHAQRGARVAEEVGEARACR